eukprot:gene31465-6651_t
MLSVWSFVSGVAAVQLLLLCSPALGATNQDLQQLHDRIGEETKEPADIPEGLKASLKANSEGCLDLFEECASWSEQGFCDSIWTINDESIKDAACPKSCGVCIIEPVRQRGLSWESSYWRLKYDGDGASRQGTRSSQDPWNDNFLGAISGSGIQDAGNTGQETVVDQGTTTNQGTSDFGNMDNTNVALSRTNLYRQRHQSPPASWNTDLEKEAQIWANNIASNCRMEHGGSNGHGQNLYSYSSSDASWSQVVDKWYNEVSQYRYGI